jgi:hypothetical protein
MAPDDRPAPVGPAIGLSLDVRLEPGAPATVSITCECAGPRGPARAARAAERSDTQAAANAETADAVVAESEPESASLVLVGALIEAQAGRLCAELGAATVWLRAAPPSA